MDPGEALGEYESSLEVKIMWGSFLLAQRTAKGKLKAKLKRRLLIQRQSRRTK